MDDLPRVHWGGAGDEHSALWRSERGAPPPAKVIAVDDSISADEAYGLACQGVGLLWLGDYQNARQMLTALASRADRMGRRGPKGKPPPPPRPMPEAFNVERQARAQRARTLGGLLIPLEADYTIPLRRAPDLRAACEEAWGPGREMQVASLRDLLGANGAHEWRRNGVEVPALGARIHPHYGVFAPIRSEYVDLVARCPLPAAVAKHSLAFDVGTGTGVLAAVLAKRGLQRVVATDMDARALACAKENIDRLGLAAKVQVVQADLFPEGQAALVVCNPPWVPARPSSPLEHGIYDPDSRMLKGFLRGLPAHLEAGGEGWLVLSDLAEHLALRTRAELLDTFAAAGLEVVQRIDVRPKHPKALDASDPLHKARVAEVTSLWRLAPL